MGETGREWRDDGRIKRAASETLILGHSDPGGTLVPATLRFRLERGVVQVSFSRPTMSPTDPQFRY